MELDDARQIALALLETSEGQRWARTTWNVGKKTFAWERPFSKADLTRFGDEPVPGGPIIAVATADLGEKAAILAENHPGFFTISHFDNYPALLIQLSVAVPQEVREAIVDAWLCCAPAALTEEYLRER